ncbi:MAG: heme ABC exporter ATP-binding protein CcmA [Gemmatimonadota bacterium]
MRDAGSCHRSLSVSPEAAAAPLLEVEGLSRAYGVVRALEDVSFVLDEGELMVVVGPNGAGKTTLVRTLARLSRPTAGAVRLAGEDWLSAPAARQREVGVLSHATYLYDRLTALENLRFYARLYGLADPDRRAREALASAGLDELADRRAGTLSRGQAQRLSIARAVIHEPRLLLLDEPLAGLDPHSVKRLVAALADLRSAGRAILLTTHDLARVPGAATRFLVLVNGSAIDSGPWKEAATDGLAERYERAVTERWAGEP